MNAALALGDSVGKAVACRALGVPRAVVSAHVAGRSPPGAPHAGAGAGCL
jgi:hypothetical protein